MTQADPMGMHDWHSATYVDEWIEVNGTNERTASLRRIPQLIPFDPEAPIRVLDIGGGWGPVTEVVLEQFPRARVTLHDFSEPMLAEARRRLAGHGEAVSYYQGDLLSPSWTSGLEGQFDAVVSHICIHNVRFPDRIRAIYEEVFPLVAAGGCFINWDHPAAGGIAGEASRQAQRMARRQQVHDETGQWVALDQLPVGGQFGRNPHSDSPPSQANLDRIAAHEPATLANQLRWLTEAGFAEAECFWRDGRDALMAAFRARLG